jgi:hypothetical protein
MNQLWLLLKLVLVTFVPLPVNPKLTRPDPKKNFWTFACDEWKSPYQLARVIYAESGPQKFTK